VPAGATPAAGPRPAVAGPPFTFDGLDGTPRSYVLTLPSTLPPGYYMLVGSEVETSASGYSASVIQVIPATP
jgi:hypothetical protein